MSEECSMRSAVYIARGSYFDRLAYSLRHPPPTQYTTTLPTLTSPPRWSSPLTLRPISLSSPSRSYLAFSTHLVRRNLSPLLKLLSRLKVNFFSILPPMIPPSPVYLLMMRFLASK